MTEGDGIKLTPEEWRLILRALGWLGSDTPSRSEEKLCEELIGRLREQLEEKK